MQLCQRKKVGGGIIDAEKQQYQINGSSSGKYRKWYVISWKGAIST